MASNTFDFAAQRAKDLAAIGQTSSPASFPRAPILPSVKEQPAFLSGGAAGGAGAGATIGSIVPGVGTIVGGLIGGLLGGILGGGPSTPTDLDNFIQNFRAAVPDQNAPICNQPINLSSLGGGGPLWLFIPCDDPNLGTASRSTIEWAIQHWGLQTFMSAIVGLLSPSPTGHPTFVEQSQAPSNAEDTIINNVNIVDQSAQRAIDNLQTSVTRGIQNTINGIEGVQQATTQSLVNTLTGFTTQLGSFTDNVGKFLGGALADSINKLFDPTSTLQKALTGDITNIGNVVSGIEGDIVGPLGKAISDLDVVFQGFPQDVGIQLDKVFSPLFKGLKDLLDGILAGDVSQLPKLLSLIQAFLSGNFNSLADIARTLERIGVIFPGSATHTINWDDISIIGAQLGKMTDQLAGIAGHTIGEIYKPGDVLKGSCDPAQLDQAISKLGGDIDAAPDWVKYLGSWALWIIGQIVGFEPAIEIALERDREFLNHACPLKKIDANILVGLMRRGIVDLDSANEEMLAQGWGEAQRKALFDGTTYQPDAATLIEHWYRDIITEDQLNTGLQQIGYTNQQIEAYKTGIFKLLDPSLLLQLWQRNLIDEDAIRKALIVQKYTTAAIDAILVSGFRPPNIQESIHKDAVLKAAGISSLFGYTGIEDVPQAVRDAGRAEGLNDDTISAQWTGHYNILDPATWLNLYYRGFRTLGELHTALDSFYVPTLLQLDLIDANRPLIPFRTIPTILASGILTEDQARHKLAQHGFSAEDTDILIKYAERSKTKATATTATAVKTLSIANARTLFDDGALTEEQYVTILEAHGYTADLAAKQAQVDIIAAHAKQRKQTLTDLEAEVSVGTITLDDALSQLSANGFTQAEIARFQSAVRRRTTANVKRPSWAELQHFFKAALITADQVKTELAAQGWLDPWLSAFMGLLVTPASAAPTTPPSTP